MPRWILAVIATLLLGERVESQTATDPNEGLNLARDPLSGAFTLSWWGRAGSTYYLLHSDDLLNWSYFPVIESGGDQVIAWGFTSGADKLFVRLQIGSTSIDSDGDGIPDSVEIAAGTDPYKKDAPIVQLQVTGFTAP